MNVHACQHNCKYFNTAEASGVYVSVCVCVYVSVARGENGKVSEKVLTFPVVKFGIKPF